MNIHCLPAISMWASWLLDQSFHHDPLGRLWLFSKSDEVRDWFAHLVLYSSSPCVAASWLVSQHFDLRLASEGQAALRLVAGTKHSIIPNEPEITRNFGCFAVDVVNPHAIKTSIDSILQYHIKNDARFPLRAPHILHSIFDPKTTVSWNRQVYYLRIWYVLQVYIYILAINADKYLSDV